MPTEPGSKERSILSSRTRFRLTALTATTLLVAAAAASGAGSLSYRGKTSQKKRISFMVSGGNVRFLDFRIVDKCAHRRILFVHNSGFPAMPISKSAFGGTFRAKAPAVATVIVSGHVSGKTVKGTLKDHSKNRKTHKFCSGKATFKLHSR